MGGGRCKIKNKKKERKKQILKMVYSLWGHLFLYAHASRLRQLMALKKVSVF